MKVNNIQRIMNSFGGKTRITFDEFSENHFLDCRFRTMDEMAKASCFLNDKDIWNESISVFMIRIFLTNNSGKDGDLVTCSPEILPWMK